ncbi:MAG: AsmA family protein [Thermodesulfovibrionales bacterium]|nr:AsmA family protein [Thermodesulfovibrionales bacterium]
MTSKTKRVIIVISLILFLSVVLLLSIAYIRYRDFKKAFVVNLSTQATSFIGQEVAVGELSFSPAGEINLHNITVYNPEGFTAGKLLTIKKLSLKMRYREIVKKKLYFEKIIVQEPELSVVQDRQGRLNISDKLREFFARKPTLEYRIDEFDIKSGIVDFNEDKKFRNDDVNVSVKNLSSERTTKTSIRGHTTYAVSRIAIVGWVYLKDEPKRLNISISSQELSLSALKESLNKYGVEITKTKATLYLNAEGDTEKGFHFTSEIGMRDAKFAFLKKDVQEILLRIQ